VETVLPVPELLPAGASLAEVPSTSGAIWLPPSRWPPVTDFLFRPREPDTDRPTVVVTRYDDVLSMILDPDETWRREIPFSVIPEEERHCVVDASWMLDGSRHRRLRRQLTSLNRGATPEAREFTRSLTRLLLTRLLEEDPPWNLVRIIDEVSLRVIIEHVLKAPPLLPHVVRLRELTRPRAPRREDDGTDCLAYFTTIRQPELEEILGTVADQASELPSGLARHLASLTRTVDAATGEPAMTRKQLVSQLGMLITSYESQAATTASLVGMLLEYGLLDYARRSVDDPGRMRRLVAEGGRRGLSFPFNILTPAKRVAVGSRTVQAGEPVLISYQAANMDPSRFGPDALEFDPRPVRASHLAFGEGVHRCQGERGAKQFIEDVLKAMLDALPLGIRLDHDGQVLREVASLSWSIADLPVVPRS
jgi:biflaviolin synthase